MEPRRGRGRGFYQKLKSKKLETPNLTYTPMTTSNKRRAKHDGSCCEITINLELDEREQIFLEKLKNLWKMLKKSPPVMTAIRAHYIGYLGNPYLDTLRLMYNCQEFYSAKPKSLPFFIIEQFGEFINSCTPNCINQYLYPETKLEAYKLLITQNSSALTKLVVDTFEMATNGEIFLDIVKCMINRKQYKEACQSIIYFNLQEHFSLEEIVIPLIYQDKIFIVDDYLASYPKHREEIVIFLDNLLGMPSTRQAIIDFANIHELPDVKWEKLQSKPIKKLITRLVKKFDLPSCLTPNLNKKRNTGALHFLLQKRYIEESFSDESWREMIQEAIKDDTDLQKDLVVEIACYGDVAEALRWAHFYNIERESWPNNVRMFADDRWTPPAATHQEEEEYWDEPQAPVDYYRLRLEVDDIVLVDSKQSFQEFMTTGLQDVDIVGMDCEWKPSFGGQKSELALMQIATRRKAFILDVPALSSNVPRAWNELSNELLNKSDILKLGFGFTSDITVIKDSISGLNFNTKQVGFLDLLNLWKQLEKYPKIVLPHVAQSGGPSLSTLVQQCLGAPLDKSEQFSNWEKRPLRITQLLYAALDAYCLIEVYDVIKRCCESEEISFDEICYNLMSNEKTPKHKNKKTAKKESQKPSVDIPQPKSHITEDIPADKIKLVCDTMLQGLGKKLRRCGIDTLILENNQDHMECVRLAQNDGRYILTRGAIFNKLVGYVLHGFCYKVLSDDIDIQLKEILSYYHIKVTKDHVFSRCQFCNGNCFVKICQATMKFMALENKPRYNVPPTSFMDEATGFSSDEDYDDDEPGPPMSSQLSNNRKWDVYPDEKIDVGLRQTRMGVQIQMANIPEGILNEVDMFYICEECGKVYWDGSHYGKVVHGALNDIVD